ncbi:MAG: hypothetical protein ACRD7E_05190, partial [Bryobacteraceae bacterium]
MRWLVLTPAVCLTALADTDAERRLELRVEMLEKRLEALEARSACSTQIPSALETGTTRLKTADSAAEPQRVELPGG